MKPLRLAMVAQRFWPRVGGLETRAAQIACGLAERGVRVTIVTSRWHVEWPAEISYRKLPVVRLSPPSIGWWRTWRWRRTLTRWLARNADEFDAVLVWGMMAEARAAIEALGPHVPVVLVPERTGWWGDCFRQVRESGGRLQSISRRAAAFVATSPAARRELEAAGYPRQRIRDVPPGAALLPLRTDITQNDARDMLSDANSALRLATRTPLVVSTTRLAADRGWEWLLAAWSIVAKKKPAARLWLAGETPQAAAAAERINHLGIASSTCLVGRFDDVSPLLTAADVHVSPTPEGAMQPLLEAMGAGVPSVAADVPLNRWLLSNPAAGLLVPDDAATLAAAILRLLDDTETAGRLGAAGWRRVLEDFGLDAMADGFCSLLETVTGCKTPRG